MTAFAQYPYDELQAVGIALSTISDQISSRSRAAFEVAGLTADQDRIAGALAHFQSEWAASLTKLGENIDGFGRLSGQIGAMSAEFDGQLARAMSPSAGHSRPMSRMGGPRAQ